MPEGKGYGPQDTASVGLNLNIIGNFAYGYSGIVSVPNNALTTMNSFMTGNYVSDILVEIHGDFAAIGQNPIRIAMALNGVEIFNDIWLSTQDASIFDFPTRVIIPPYTEVIVSVLQAQGSPQDMSTTLAGKIYK